MAHRLVGKRRERLQDGRGGTQCIKLGFEFEAMPSGAFWLGAFGLRGSTSSA